MVDGKAEFLDDGQVATDPVQPVDTQACPGESQGEGDKHMGDCVSLLSFYFGTLYMYNSNRLALVQREN